MLESAFTDLPLNDVLISGSEKEMWQFFPCCSSLAMMSWIGGRMLASTSIWMLILNLGQKVEQLWYACINLPLHAGPHLKQQKLICDSNKGATAPPLSTSLHCDRIKESQECFPLPRWVTAMREDKGFLCNYASTQVIQPIISWNKVNGLLA